MAGSATADTDTVLDVAAPTLEDWTRERVWVAAVRRARDVCGALLLLAVVAPLLLVIAVAIRRDSTGPVLFRQRRVGRGMRPFTVLKFRTMRTDSDPAPHREYVRALIDGDNDSREGLYKLVGDVRVTRVGHSLRRWSLDELPQLWNVVRGDMSLVGPRPVIPYEVERYPAWYLGRFAVRPGLTGLWQVSGRNQRTYEEMVRLDLDYVARQTLRGDAVILAKTVRVVLGRGGVA
jgi:lipopolysaccharide/colanic/teichoic acid biosynthesis glycosyltransferase